MIKSFVEMDVYHYRNDNKLNESWRVSQSRAGLDAFESRYGYPSMIQVGQELSEKQF